MGEKINKCILCNEVHLKSLDQFDAGDLVRCSNCGMVFSSRIPSGSELEAHYKGYAFFSGISNTTIKRYNQLLDKFEKYRVNNKILDVGCGEGFFLEQAVKRGWQAYGTECVPQYVPICEKKQIIMDPGILDLRNYPPESFDIITSFEVLEHLNYPIQEVNNFHSLLRKDGLLYVTTPNFNSISRRIQGKAWRVITYPDHLSYFTPGTIRQVMKLNGFKKVELLTTGISFEGIRKNIWGRKNKSTGKEANNENYQPEDMEMQERIEKSAILRIVKGILNFLLTLTGTGDGIKAMYRKK